MAHGVFFFGAGRQEPWFLLTSEVGAEVTVALYRERRKMEAEFRDL
ncbi:MAG: hypothetical protein HY320_04580 [Armatimonadetes bacterium]|nr:hypothetical protein [Armatimonadota bacterium]